MFVIEIIRLLEVRAQEVRLFGRHRRQPLPRLREKDEPAQFLHIDALIDPSLLHQHRPELIKPERPARASHRALALAVAADDALHTLRRDGLGIISELDQKKPPMSSVLRVHVQHRMRRRAGAGEGIEDDCMFLVHHAQYLLNQFMRLRRIKDGIAKNIAHQRFRLSHCWQIVPNRRIWTCRIVGRKFSCVRFPNKNIATFPLLPNQRSCSLVALNSCTSHRPARFFSVIMHRIDFRSIRRNQRKVHRRSVNAQAVSSILLQQTITITSSVLVNLSIRFHNFGRRLLCKMQRRKILRISKNVFVVRRHRNFVIIRAVHLAPDECRNAVALSKNFIANRLQVRLLIIINADENRPVISEQLPQELQPRIHHAQPLVMARQILSFFSHDLPEPGADARVVHIVIVDPILVPRVVRRIDVDAIHAPLVLRQQRLQRHEVVAVDDHVPVVRAALRMHARRIKRIFFLQHMIRHVEMMIHDLALPDPLQHRHTSFTLRTDFLDIFLAFSISKIPSCDDVFFALTH